MFDISHGNHPQIRQEFSVGLIPHEHTGNIYTFYTHTLFMWHAKGNATYGRVVLWTNATVGMHVCAKFCLVQGFRMILQEQENGSGHPRRKINSGYYSTLEWQPMRTPTVITRRTLDEIKASRRFLPQKIFVHPYRSITLCANSCRVQGAPHDSGCTSIWNRTSMFAKQVRLSLGQGIYMPLVEDTPFCRMVASLSW